VLDEHSPSGRAPRRRRLRRVATFGVAAAFGLGLATPALALSPYLDQPMTGLWLDDGGWDYQQPVDQGWDSAPDPAPAPAPAPAEEPVPLRAPAPAPVPEPVSASPVAGDQSAQTQAQTTQPQAEEILVKAVADARAKLDPASPCATLVGSYAGMSARDVLDAINRAHKFLAMPDRSTADNAPAETFNGGGPEGVIGFYKPFFGELGPTSPDDPASVPYVNTYNTGNHDYVYVLTPEEFRALVVLHELRHVQGNLSGDHNGNLREENEDIVAKCFPNARRVPNPNRLPAASAPSAPIPTTPPIDTGVTVTDIMGPVENPRGSYPTITVDGVELDGGYYSEAPVITVDGVELEGGEVGPYPDTADAGQVDGYDYGYDDYGYDDYAYYYGYDYGYDEYVYEEELAD
jgi:hypothetical protein